MSDKPIRTELQEAIDAGEDALASLQKAKSCLSSAGNWGLVDILGGGLISGLIKHSKLDEAGANIDRARRDLHRFERELSDIEDIVEGVNVGEFLSFADFFFDGFVADMLVQSKINKMKKQVDEAIFRVEGILHRLYMQN